MNTVLPPKPLIFPLSSEPFHRHTRRLFPVGIRRIACWRKNSSSNNRQQSKSIDFLFSLSALDLVGIAWRYPGISGLGSGILRLVGLVLFTIRHSHSVGILQHCIASICGRCRHSHGWPRWLSADPMHATYRSHSRRGTGSYFLMNCDHDDTASGLLTLAAPELSTIATTCPSEAFSQHQCTNISPDNLLGSVRHTPNLAHFLCRPNTIPRPGKPRDAVDENERSTFSHAVVCMALPGDLERREWGTKYQLRGRKSLE